MLASLLAGFMRFHWRYLNWPGQMRIIVLNESCDHKWTVFWRSIPPVLVPCLARKAGLGGTSQRGHIRSLKCPLHLHLGQTTYWKYTYRRARTHTHSSEVRRKVFVLKVLSLRLEIDL